MRFLRLLSARQHRKNPTLKAIFIASYAGAPMQSVANIQAIVNLGLRGDRYSEASGFWKATDACQVTLISEDDLNRAKYGRTILLQDKLNTGNHRRNLVVGGLDTKQLQDRTIRIGQAVFRYCKPRPPCAYLDKIEGQGISQALGKHSGVCLKVIQSGTISVDDAIEFIDAD